ncbi:MAG TPA: hypothetical protein VNT77_06345 [Allosphingosinicella sp.]|nr:hypothetical protein [Allosphingosinicella sp.]
MHKLLAAAASALLLSVPAQALQKPGDRTVSPEDLLKELGAGVSDAELERAVAAAAAHPLGTLENPIRVGGPEGQRAYIERLRCANGARPAVGARDAAGVGAFGSIVDAYPLDCGAAAPGKVRLVMDMYHAEHREDRAPAGFSIDPR